MSCQDQFQCFCCCLCYFFFFLFFRNWNMYNMLENRLQEEKMQSDECRLYLCRLQNVDECRTMQMQLKTGGLKFRAASSGHSLYYQASLKKNSHCQLLNVCFTLCRYLAWDLEVICFADIKEFMNSEQDYSFNKSIR